METGEGMSDLLKSFFALAFIATLSGCATDPVFDSPLGAVGGIYDCDSLTPEQAQVLLDQGHTYLDLEHDNIACGTLTVTANSQAQAQAQAAAALMVGSVGDVGANHDSFSGTRYRCADLTDEQAQLLLSKGHSYLDKDGDGDACEPDSRRDYSPRSRSGCTWVNGYTRKNGTHVRGHQRCR